MKKAVSFVLALALLLGCLSTAALAGGIETWYVKTGNGRTLNVRDITTGQVIGSLPYRGTCGVTEWHGQWAYIVWGGIGDAKVMAKFLVREDPGPFKGNTEPTVFTDSALGSTTVDGLNKQYSSMQSVTPYSVYVNPDTKSGTARMRWAPSKNSTLLALLPANYELKVLAANQNWLMVQDPATQKIGFIAVKFTRL